MIQDLAVTSGQLAIILASFSAGLAFLWKAVRFFRKLVYAFDLITHELLPNSGRSLRDATDRTEENILIIAEHIGIADQLKKRPEEGPS